MIIILLAANIRALQDIWFIGDHLIRQAYPYLQQMQDEYTAGRDNYLHGNYDTYMFYPNFAENNVLTMVRNGMIEALNNRLKLPSAVIILTNDQLIVEDPLYLPSEIDRKLKWILREIDAAVKIRKSCLPPKAYVFGEPRIMWVRAFQNTRADNIPKETLLKFNNMLCRICMAKAVYTIPVPTYEESTTRCFDYDGKTQIKAGFENLWVDIIQGLKKHDQNDKQAEIERVLKENPRRPSHEDLRRERMLDRSSSLERPRQFSREREDNSQKRSYEGKRSPSHKDRHTSKYSKSSHRSNHSRRHHSSSSHN